MPFPAVRVLLILLAAATLPVATQAAEPDLKALLAKVDDANRGESSHAIIEMQVKTKRYERTMKMENWSEGAERSLIKILEPAKDQGVATLKVDDNLWNYLPNTDRTMKVPSAMMSGAWMGSHLSNDDLVRENRLSDDYSFVLAESLTDDLVIRCTPKPETAVVWGHVDVTVTADGIPVRQVFFDEDGVKIRTMDFTDRQTIGGRVTPMTMTVTPHDKPGEFTRFRFTELQYDPELPEGFFSIQSLKR